MVSEAGFPRSLRRIVPAAVLLLATALAPGVGGAQTELALPDAVRQALDSNLDFLARRQSLAAAREEIGLARSELLPQAPSMSGGDAGHGSDCSLISFCPSKQPMRVVHERIQRLFDEIHLDELCAMTPVCSPSEPDADRSTQP